MLPEGRNVRLGTKVDAVANPTISLRSLIYRNFLASSLITILTIEAVSLLLYFGSNAFIAMRYKQTLLAEVRENAQTISEKEAQQLDAQFHSVSILARLLQVENQRYFENPSCFALPGPPPEFAVATNGAFYKVNEAGGSLFLARHTPVTEAVRAKAEGTEAFDPLYRGVVENVPDIVAVYFNSFDDMNRYYPFIPKVYEQYDPDLTMTNYNFYYLADAHHDPERKPVWTGAYLDPAGQGWMISCVVPVYRGDFLEGVTGLDVTIKNIVDHVLDMKLPWEAHALLLDPEGTILAMPQAVENLLDMKELKEHVYDTAVSAEVLKPEAFNLLNHHDADISDQFSRFMSGGARSAFLRISGKDILAIQSQIRETGWRLMILVDRDTVFQPIYAMHGLFQRVGYGAIGAMLLFYAGFFVYLLNRSRHLADRIAQPVSRLVQATADIARTEKAAPLAMAGIGEIDSLSEHFNEMSQRLQDRGRALREQSEIQSALLSTIPVHVFLKARDLTYIMANRSFLGLVGLSAGQIVGKTDYDLFPAELATAFRKDDQSVLEADTPKLGIEEMLTNPDGSMFWVSTSKLPFHNEAQEVVGLVGVSMDITDRKKMEEHLQGLITERTAELREANRGLELELAERKKASAERDQLEVQLRHAQKMESIGQLAAGVAHEINTPIQFVGDNTRFLRDSFQELLKLVAGLEVIFKDADGKTLPPEELRMKARQLIETADVEYLSREIPTAIAQSLDGIQRVSQIVHAMKEFTHPDVNEKVLTDMNKAIESTLTVSRNEWKYAAEMVTQLEPDLPLVPCIPGDINQVVLNLVVNGAQAIAEKQKDGDDAMGTITVTTRSADNGVEILVCDTGAGISEEHRAHIFEPFFTTKEVGKGTGQGLAIAYNTVVKKHGGRISFESEVGWGTMFTVWLPV